VLESGTDGGYRFRTVVAAPYPIPDDGPVGRMLAATARHPWRPAHIHFIVTAPGHRVLTTHVSTPRPSTWTATPSSGNATRS